MQYTYIHTYIYCIYAYIYIYNIYKYIYLLYIYYIYIYLNMQDIHIYIYIYIYIYVHMYVCIRNRFSFNSFLLINCMLSIYGMQQWFGAFLATWVLLIGVPRSYNSCINWLACLMKQCDQCDQCDVVVGIWRNLRFVWISYWVSNCIRQTEMEYGTKWYSMRGRCRW